MLGPVRLRPGITSTPPRDAVWLAPVLFAAFGGLLLAVGIRWTVPQEGNYTRWRSTISDATTIRSGVQLFRLDHPSICPTTGALIKHDVLDRTTRLTDGWGGPFMIECNGADIWVVSAGPDQRWGTADDIDNDSASPDPVRPGPKEDV